MLQQSLFRLINRGVSFLTKCGPAPVDVLQKILFYQLRWWSQLATVKSLTLTFRVNQPGTFNCVHARCKTCPFIHNWFETSALETLYRGWFYNIDSVDKTKLSKPILVSLATSDRVASFLGCLPYLKGKAGALGVRLASVIFAEYYHSHLKC